MGSNPDSHTFPNAFGHKTMLCEVLGEGMGGRQTFSCLQLR